MTQTNDLDDFVEIMSNRYQAQQRAELRDRIAIAAMQAFIDKGRISSTGIAFDAYDMADAMLEQRDKK